MKKIYLDMTEATLCMGVFVAGAEVIPAGAYVCPMSVKHKNAEYERYADEYDIHFIFEDKVPVIDFYTIPMVEIFAVDSAGGYIGSLGQATDLQEDIPICYIDKEKKCYLVAENGEKFLEKVSDWKAHLRTCAEIEVYGALEEAKRKYQFLDRGAMEQELSEVKAKKRSKMERNIPE